MPLELDHLFVCVQPEAPEAEHLFAFGLQEGRRRVHSGQGTSNVCFFFHNAYLELLWMSNSEEIQSATVRPLGLWERCRWRETQACPFGIAFRFTSANASDCPFPTWNYQAAYLPAGAAIPIATNSTLMSEPLIFISPVAPKPVAYPIDRRPPLVHQPGLIEITRLRVTLPEIQALSPESTSLSKLKLVEFVEGDRYHLDIEFDRGNTNQSHDFHPVLPLSIRW